MVVPSNAWPRQRLLRLRCKSFCGVWFNRRTLRKVSIARIFWPRVRRSSRPARVPVRDCIPAAVATPAAAEPAAAADRWPRRDDPKPILPCGGSRDSDPTMEPFLGSTPTVLAVMLVLCTSSRQFIVVSLFWLPATCVCVYAPRFFVVVVVVVVVVAVGRVVFQCVSKT